MEEPEKQPAKRLREALANAQPPKIRRARPKAADGDEEPVAPPAGWGAPAGKKVVVSKLSMPVSGMAGTLGLRMPGLSLQHLLQVRGLPLASFYRLIGPPGVGKSTLQFEIIRWFLKHQGLGKYIRTEPKDHPIQRNGVLRYNRAWIGDPNVPAEEQLDLPLQVRSAPSTQEWQYHLTTGIKDQHKINEGVYRGFDPYEAREKIDKMLADPKERAKLPYWAFPVVLCVDSLTGALGEGTLKNVSESGHGSRAFSEHALITSQYMGAMAHWLDDTAMVVIGTNHDKPVADEYGNIRSNTPGGKAPQFSMLAEIEVSESEKSKPTATGSVRVLRLRTVNKNGLGEQGKWIDVPVHYDIELDEAGRTRSVIRFDWGASTTRMLQALERAREQGKWPKSKWDKLKEVLDFSFAKGRAHSKVLGIPESDPVSYSRFGDILNANDEVCQALYPVLNIVWTPLYRPGVRLDAQRRTCLSPDAPQPPDVYEDDRAEAAGHAEAADDE